MSFLTSLSGSLVICLSVWIISFISLPKIEKVNLVQRLNFGTINALFVLVFIHLVLG